MSHVGVVFALGIEAGGVEDLLKSKLVIRGHGFRIVEGRLHRRQVTIAVSGPGGAAAAHATEALLDAHQPACIISAGFAGGLDPRLARHDLVIANSLASAESEPLPIELPPQLIALATAPRIHIGRLLTVDHVVRLPEQRKQLADKHQAVAADMETLWVAQVCRRRNVRFFAVRVLSDALGDELPPDTEHLLRQKTFAAQLGAALGRICRRPGSVKTLWALHQNAVRASDRLADFLARAIEPLERVSGQCSV